MEAPRAPSRTFFLCSLSMDSFVSVRDDLEGLGESNSCQCTPRECYGLIGKQDQIKIFHMNIRSINCNFNELLVLLAEIRSTIDVIILSECWLSKVCNLPVISGYKSYSTNIHINQSDGVVIYVKTTLDCIVECPDFGEGTVLVCKFKKDLAIVGIYRSPSFANTDNFVNNLNAVLANLSQFRSVAILGDINIDILPTNSSGAVDDYLNMLASQGYLATHFIATHGKTCYDHVILKSHLWSKTLVISSTITDHFATMLCLQSSPIRPTPATYIKQIDYQSALKSLSETDLDDFYDISDANYFADYLVSKLMSIIDENSKLRKISRRKRPLKPWITPGLLKCMRNRDHLHLKVKKDPTNEVLKLTYSRYRNFCRKLLHKLKRAFERDRFDKAKNNPKATWDAVKMVTHLSNRTDSSFELLGVNDNPMNSVNFVNKYFATIGESLANDIVDINSHSSLPLHLFPQSSQLNSLVLLEVDNKEIENIITNFKNDCAAGWDGIPVLFIKTGKDILTPIITRLCNLCITTGIFPNAFKQALVHPIYKCGDKSEVSNYRPISVLNILSKILEKVLNKRLMGFLEHESILSKNQYGFRRGVCTEDAVLSLTEAVSSILDKKHKCLAIFLDLKKAFDTVSIPILLNKLQNVGVRGAALNIFSDYLTNRTQRVKIKDKISQPSLLSFGVPQGSVLGPTLFLLYVNQLCQFRYPGCTVFAYADDTALLVEGVDWPDVERKADEILRLVTKWLAHNLLTLNVLKTTYVAFSITAASRPPPTLSIRAHTCEITTGDCPCSSLTRSTHVKYLGVVVDENLSWHHQVESVKARTRKLIYIFKLLRNSADTSIMKMVYFALAQSLISYCITVWGGAPKTTLLPLERAQRAVIKIINKKSFRFPTHRLYAEYRVLTVRQLFVLQAILRCHRTLKYDPKHTSSRRKDLVCDSVPHKTAFATRQYWVLGPRLYNRASRNIDLYPLIIFECKKKIMSWLLQLNYDETEDLLQVPI